MTKATDLAADIVKDLKDGQATGRISVAQYASFKGKVLYSGLRNTKFRQKLQDELYRLGVVEVYFTPPREEFDWAVFANGYKEKAIDNDSSNGSPTDSSGG